MGSYQKNIDSIGRVKVASIATLTLACFFIFITIYKQQQLENQAKKWVYHTYEVTERLHEFSRRFKNIELNYQQYIISGKQEHLKTLNQSLYGQKDTHSLNNNLLVDDLEKITDLVHDNTQQIKSVSELENLTKEVISFIDKKIAEGPGIQNSDIEQNNKYIAKINDIISSMLEEEQKLLGNRSEYDRTESDFNFHLIFTIIGFAYLGLLAAMLLLIKQWKAAIVMENQIVAKSEEIKEANILLSEKNAQLLELSKNIEKNSWIRFAAVVNNAMDGKIILGSGGLIESINPAGEKIFGYSKDELIEKNIKVILPEPYTDEKHISAVKGQETIGYKKDGTVFPVDINVTSFEIEDDKFISITVRDISARKEAEHKLLTYTRALEHSNQELDDFAYIASHDLKEPLRGIFNHSTFLLEDYEDKLDEDGIRRLKRLGFLSQRMEHLINDLLYFSRLGRTELAVQEIDPKSIIEDITGIIDAVEKNKKIDITINEPLPRIICDRPRMTEVFRNLITNAIKYNDKENPIIEIGFLKKVRHENDWEEDVFYVKDNGIGIAPEFHNEIFRIFKRVSKKAHDDDSTGVGLTFVKKIIENHHGNIWLESDLGKGTIFYFTLNQGAYKWKRSSQKHKLS